MGLTESLKIDHVVSGWENMILDVVAKLFGIHKDELHKKREIKGIKGEKKAGW